MSGREPCKNVFRAWLELMSARLLRIPAPAPSARSTYDRILTRAAWPCQSVRPRTALLAVATVLCDVPFAPLAAARVAHSKPRAQARVSAWQACLGFHTPVLA